MATRFITRGDSSSASLLNIDTFTESIVIRVRREKRETMSIEEQNKVVIRQMQTAAERDGFAAQAEFFAERCFNHGEPVTREMIRGILHDIQTTFPDAKLELINLVAEGDWVVGRYTLSGTHQGVGLHPFVHEGLLTGVPPTGKKIKVQHIHMFRLQDGQIVEHWACRDDVDMMRQLGLPLSIAQPQLAAYSGLI